MPLPPPTSSFAQPTVDVSKDAETGSPVVTVYPEADARPEPETELESASARDANVNAEVFGAVGTRAPRSQSNFNDTVGDNRSDMGAPDTLPAVSNPQVSGTGTTTTTAPSAPTALEKPISVVPMSGAFSPPPPPPKDTTTTTTPRLTTQQDAETRSTSSDSDAAMPGPSMGSLSEDKLGGRGRGTASRGNEDPNADDEDVADETNNESGPGKQKKNTGAGASKLLGKMKEKLKTGHGQKA